VKQLTVGKLRQGEVFKVAGHEYVVLDHVGEGVLALESNVLEKTMPFGETNDWRESPIREYLNGEYLNDLEKNGIELGDILPLTIDLKETNGGREYGHDTCQAGLLTLEQYCKYCEHIPLADDWWWLATPWATPNGRSPLAAGSRSARGVNTSGALSNNFAFNGSLGVRPLLIFLSSLFVPIDGDDAGSADKDLDGLADKVAARVSKLLKGAT